MKQDRTPIIIGHLKPISSSERRLVLIVYFDQLLSSDQSPRVDSVDLKLEK